MRINVIVMLANSIRSGIFNPACFKCFSETVRIRSTVAGYTDWINVLRKSDWTVQHQDGNVVVQLFETESFVTNHLPHFTDCIGTFCLAVVVCSVANMDSHVEYVRHSDAERYSNTILKVRYHED